MAAGDIIRIQSEEELNSILTETFINASPLVNVVADDSAIQGVLRGAARVAKKQMKDIALAVSHIFVDSASGDALDRVAQDHGIAARFLASQSSTFVRVRGDVGTEYLQGVHVVSDNKGNAFDLEEDVTIGQKGFAYIKVRSQQSGSKTNVNPNTIVNIAPVPTGHIGLVNEVRATGGRDLEDDPTFRQRIKEGPDILSRGTVSYLTQAFIKANPNVLKVYFEGINQQGKVVISIVTQNGIDLTQNELDYILDQSSQYLSLTELNPVGTRSFGVELKNTEYHPIDIDFRCELTDITKVDDVARDIQVRFQKYVDYRFWDSSKQNVEWDELLQIAKKSSRYVRYIPDTNFNPRVDIKIAKHKLPRFRGFIMRDLNGNVLVNQSGTLVPSFYPNEVDTSFTETVL